MAKGLSLHIGLDSVDPAHYDGWSGPLNACEADARAMDRIAEDRGFQRETLLTTAGTREAVEAGIRKAASALGEGDTFLLTYAGHGGQVPDYTGEEEDNADETWCLYDGQMLDDELYALWGTFHPGVRILMVSDSCHSGTMARVARDHGPDAVVNGAVGMRFMPPAAALRTYEANRGFYDDLGTKFPAGQTAPVEASVLLLSGCQDNQYSSDGAFNGLFTGTLLRVWAGGSFPGAYPAFHQRIVGHMPPRQTPNYFTVGVSNPTFEGETPFSI